MTQNIVRYYLPQNPNISKGKIYTLYLNKATNLDLTSIMPKKDLTMNVLLQPNKEAVSQQPLSTSTMTLTEEDYTKILSLADTSTKLYNQSQELIKKITKGRKSK